MYIYILLRHNFATRTTNFYFPAYIRRVIDMRRGVISAVGCVLLLMAACMATSIEGTQPVKLERNSYLTADRGQMNRCIAIESSNCAEMRSKCSLELGGTFYFEKDLCSESGGETLEAGMSYTCCSERKLEITTRVKSRLMHKGEFSLAQGFDWALVNTSASLSAQAYCENALYLSNNYSDYATNFIPTFKITSADHDVSGFIGYRNEDQTIYVVFRGSSSLTNFIDDMDFFQTPYPYCEACSVHKGFYSANLVVVKDVIAEVFRLQKIFASYQVVVTGHSLGAAIATLCAVDLVAADIKRVTLINFGSPRVGDNETASYISERITNKYRITHRKDVVPHLPLSLNFMHISGEWYEDDSGMTGCDGFEDFQCSYQWYLTSISDHSMYLGRPMGIAGCTLDDLDVAATTVADLQKKMEI
jgi:hypothetical protein